MSFYGGYSGMEMEGFVFGRIKCDERFVCMVRDLALSASLSSRHSRLTYFASRQNSRFDMAGPGDFEACIRNSTCLSTSKFTSHYFFLCFPAFVSEMSRPTCVKFNGLIDISLGEPLPAI